MKSPLIHSLSLIVFLVVWEPVFASETSNTQPNDTRDSISCRLALLDASSNIIGYEFRDPTIPGRSLPTVCSVTLPNFDRQVSGALSGVIAPLFVFNYETNWPGVVPPLVE